MTILPKATPEETEAWLGGGIVIMGRESLVKKSNSISTKDISKNGSTMKSKLAKSKPIFNFETFELSFMSNLYDRENKDEDGREQNHFKILQQMQASLPKSAIYLGTIEDEVSNFTNWKIEDHFYLLRIRIRPYNWAIVRITWDDNWGRYEWSGDVRCSGLLQSADAGPLLIDALFKHWDIDIKSKQNRSYRNLLKNLK